MRNNHWKFRKIVAAAWPVVPQFPDRRKRGGFLIEKRPRVHHTPSFWYRGIATRVTPGSRAGSRHWSGRFRFISTRTAIGRPRGYRLFAFCPRNDVLRVSAYMQPSDRAWQIGFADVCMCIVHHSRTDRAACTHRRAPRFSVCVHTYRKPKLEDTSRGGVELPASQMGLRHAAQPRVSKGIYIYISFSSHPRRIVDRSKGESRESPDRDPRISRKNNYFGEPNSVYSERTALKFDCRGCARAAHLHFEFLLTGVAMVAAPANHASYSIADRRLQ